MSNGNSYAKNHDGVQPQEGTSKRYTYADCIRGTIPLPHDVNGATLFQVLMVGGMVTFMVTFNGLRNTGLGFIAHTHWLYPLMFALAFLVRTFIGSKVANALAKRFVFPYFEGVKRGIGMTVVNVCSMAPIMCAIATLLICGTDDFLVRYLTTLPLMAVIAGPVNFFVVGPIVKLVFNRIAPANGLGLLANLAQNVPSLARMLGC